MKQKNTRFALYLIIFALLAGAVFVALKDIEPQTTHVTKTISEE